MAASLRQFPARRRRGLVGASALGVYVTYKLLDIADLTVDSSLCTGGDKRRAD